MARVLVFSTLFPNAAQPNHGIFVENRLRETVGRGGLDAVVLAPVPWFPFKSRHFGRYAGFARAPRHEVRGGLDVFHPRYLAVPGAGYVSTPGFLYRAALRAVRVLEREGRRFDVIDAHYAFPDGVVAARLGRALRLPVVITARGSDVTEIACSPRPRARIRWAAQEACATVAVCDDLGRRLVDLGAAPERNLVLRNGVDLALFKPADRRLARAALGLGVGFVLLSVGALIERKGHALTIAALTELPDCTLAIVGGGPLRGELEALADRLGVSARVRFLGEVAHGELPRVYAAADAFVLASSREGWANVLLEAMACGTPVIASDVNGTAEVVRSPDAGSLLAERTPSAIASAVRRLQSAPLPREATRRYAERFGWEPIARANGALLKAAAHAGYDGRHARGIVDAARVHLAEP